MSCPTTRRYPRTLAEAWPKEHANPIHFYPSRRVPWRGALCFAGFAVIWLVLYLGV